VSLVSDGCGVYRAAPIEMFDRIRDVNFFAIDPGFFESAIHDFSGRSDKRFSRHVFIIAGLLTD